ncbi:MAG TPA: DUF1572 family protein [Blastocatellia bacterium]|nr:DUF1572 family protein [Blastocatellia bacterium]
MLTAYATELAKYKKLGEQTMAQLSEAALNHVPAADANSIAMIVRHLHGNLCSRFTDFLTTDGEKPGRNRGLEFSCTAYTRAEVEQYWAEGWAQLESVLSALTADDLHRIVTIKGKAMTANDALCRALAHMAYHVGQIVLLGRIAQGASWQYLSTPR